MALKTLIFIVLLLGSAWLLTLWKAARHEAQAEASHPPTGEFLEIDGQRVHYVVQGEGPDLVLIHGASGNLRDWTFDAVERLSARYRVIAFDRPGLGYTPRINTSGATIREQAALLSEAAAQLGAERPIVLGQSYGGAVALAWAVQHPERMSALVLLAAASHPWESDLSTYYKITSGPLGPLAIPVITAWVPERVIDDTLTEIFEPQQVSEGYGAHIGAGLTLRRESLRANALQRANLLAEIEELHVHYPQITVPAELLHGSADTTVGLHIHSEPLARRMPDANLTILPGMGHMPQHMAIPEMDAAIDRAASRAGLR